MQAGGQLGPQEQEKGPECFGTALRALEAPQRTTRPPLIGLPPRCRATSRAATSAAFGS